jgi:hypothetical protein
VKGGLSFEANAFDTSLFSLAEKGGHPSIICNSNKHTKTIKNNNNSSSTLNALVIIIIGKGSLDNGLS